MQHLAGVAVRKDRFDTGGDIACIKADRPCGRDGGQQRIADTMFSDRISHILIHCLHRTGRKKRLRIEEWEGAFFLCQIDGRQIGGARQSMKPLFGLLGSLGRTVAQPDHKQRVRQTRDSKTNSPLGLRLLRLCFEREP